MGEEVNNLEYENVKEQLDRIMNSMEVPSINSLNSSLPFNDNQFPLSAHHQSALDDYGHFFDSLLSVPPSVIHPPRPPPLANIVSSAIPSRVPYTPSPSAFTPTVTNGNSVCTADTPSEKVHQIDQAIVPNIIHDIPRHPYTGGLGFTASVDTVNSKWKFETFDDKKLLFVKSDTLIPVEFKSSEPLPLSALIRATVIYEDPVLSMSPVKNTNSSRFMETSMGSGQNEHASSFLGHDCILFKVSDLVCNSSNLPYAILKFSCTSVQLKGASYKKAPGLLLVFQLLIDNEQEGVDLFHIKVCACVNRDYKRCVSTRSVNPPPPKRPKADSNSSCGSVEQAVESVMDLFSINPNMNLTNGIEPNANGEYTFMWRGTDKGLLNLFLILEKAHELGKKTN